MPALDLSAGIAHDLARSLAHALEEGQDVVVTTSGSTGTAKKVVLPARALLASAHATLELLGGPGQWLAALTPTHVGGLQVWVRSHVSGVEPVDLVGVTGQPSSRFTATKFTAATAQMATDQRRYVSLVPTQIQRLLADPAGLQALTSFDRVLIGGAALAPALAARLTQAQVVWTHTYGMSESCGGCAYDGIPLPVVTLTTDGRPGEPGRLMISGPVLAKGYLDLPDLTDEAFVTIAGTRWFRSSDLGIQDLATGRWRVLGRMDDVINTGGHKVHPDAVRDALLALPAIDDAAVVAVPDVEWGQRVAAILIPRRGDPDMAALMADPRGWVQQLRPAMPGYAVPSLVHIADALPRLPSGKVDGAGVRAAFTQEDDRI